MGSCSTGGRAATASYLSGRLGPMPGRTASASAGQRAARRARARGAALGGGQGSRRRISRGETASSGAAPLAEDLARVRAARETLGPDLALRGDANGAWTRDEAREALAALADFRFDYVEQPLAAEDVAGLVALRGQSSVRIGADESVANEAGARRLLEAGAVDVFVLKPAALGGPLRALQIAVAARRAGIEVVFTHAFESAVGAHQALHCAAAWGDASTVHGLVTAGLFDADVAEPVAARDGFVELGSKPGLGIEP